MYVHYYLFIYFLLYLLFKAFLFLYLHFSIHRKCDVKQLQPSVNAFNESPSKVRVLLTSTKVQKGSKQRIVRQPLAHQQN